MIDAAERLVKVLQQRKLKVAFAESMTAGLAAHMLSRVTGTMDVLVGSIVCYHPEVKTCLLKVSEDMIREYTCESKEVTDALVNGLPEVMNADIYAAITGLASNGGSEEPSKPVGTVFLSVLYDGGLYHSRLLLDGDSLSIQEKACETLFSMIEDLVLTSENSPAEGLK